LTNELDTSLLLSSAESCTTASSSNADLNNSNANSEQLIQSQVIFRNKMGQKIGKQADEAINSSDLIKEIAVAHNLVLPKTSGSSASSSGGSSAASTTSSKSKSNHYSAISNDSGCYTDRYSSPSGSSLLYLYDLSSKEEAAKFQAKVSYRSVDHSTRHIANTKTKTLTSKCSAKITAANIRTLRNLQTMHRNSLCDSIILSCSSSSSNSCINTCGESKPTGRTQHSEEDDLLNDSDLDSGHFANKNSELSSKRAQILCDQLNKILNISTILVNEETGINNSNVDGKISDESTDTTDPKGLSKKMKLKTLNGTVKPQSSKLKSGSKNKTISRSYTFSNSVKDMKKMNDCSVNVIKNFMDHEANEDATHKTMTPVQNNKSSNKFSNMILKNGRRILSTLNNSTKRGGFSNKAGDLAGQANSENKSALKKEETLINLIAAKLMSENIELAKQPYTDEVIVCF
jgi:hypothetical protein